jgi:hypothetical protein
MATLHIFAVGRMSKGHADLRVAPMPDGTLQSMIDEGNELDAIFAPVVVDDSDIGFDLFDYEGEADDLEEARADEDFWRSGC